MDYRDQHENYFAYGANMSAKYLARIRNVQVLHSKPAILRGYGLRFNLKGLNFLEPGFANICANPEELVEGVVHRVTKADMDKILKSEPNKYKIIDIELSTQNQSLMAKSLIYLADSDVAYKPSKRYLHLLANAAVEHGLSRGYIEKLNSNQYVYYPVLSEIFGSIIYLYLRLNTK